MWIPVIVILWQLGPAQAWLNFPQPTFPFDTLEICEDYTTRVREAIITNPTYRDGWSACVEVPDKVTNRYKKYEENSNTEQFEGEKLEL